MPGTPHAPWLEVPPEARQVCEASDHYLDALVSSLVARAAERNLTVAPTADEAPYATREGWIHVPTAGSLEYLAADA